MIWYWLPASWTLFSCLVYCYILAEHVLQSSLRKKTLTWQISPCWRTLCLFVSESDSGLTGCRILGWKLVSFRNLDIFSLLLSYIAAKRHIILISDILKSDIFVFGSVKSLKFSSNSCCSETLQQQASGEFLLLLFFMVNKHFQVWNTLSLTHVLPIPILLQVSGAFFSMLWGAALVIILYYLL